MIVKTEKELEHLKEIGKICAHVLTEMIKKVEPGITTGMLDSVAAELFNKYGAVSAPISVYDFPGQTCISINEEIAHGIPGMRVIKEGDMVNIDVSASLHGYFADTAYTVMVGAGDKIGLRMIEASHEALQMAIKEAVAGNKLSMIGKATEDAARRHGFKTIRNLCGHGVGRTIHEHPETINTYYDPRDRRLIENGIVLAIEPFIAERDQYVNEDNNDGWTLRTPHRTRAAQCEHTVVVTDGEPIITTLRDEFEFITL